jgi:hypothetical protein
MTDVSVELDERSRIDELNETLAREQLALPALAFDRPARACVLGLVA